MLLLRVVALAGLLGCMMTAAESPTLWYRQPANIWNEALPVGNGRLGAMVFGAVRYERIQLNEDTVWAGERRNRINPQAAAAIPKIRKLLFEGRVPEAEALADTTLLATTRRMPPYQTLGDLKLEFPATDDPQDYRRELNLDTGVMTIRYTQGGVHFTREVFASAPSGVIVIRITASRPGSVNFSATLTREADARTDFAGDNTLRLTGEAITHNDKNYGLERKVGSRFVGMVRILNEGGTLSRDGARISVSDANAVTLLVAATTNLREPDPAAATDRVLSIAARNSYQDLRTTHIADHQRLFRRVSLNLGTANPLLSALPTDERLTRIQKGADDPGIVALYFQFGRYLLMGSSRPGSTAANLQGIWNESLDPPWGSNHQHQHRDELLAGRGL